MTADTLLWGCGCLMSVIGGGRGGDLTRGGGNGKKNMCRGQCVGLGLSRIDEKLHSYDAWLVSKHEKLYSRRWQGRSDELCAWK